MNIEPLTPCFAGQVTGIDLTRPLTAQQVAAIEAAMDRYAVLVFHDQPFDDETQMAFSRNFGELEISSGGEMARPEDRRLKLEMADISNLDRDNKLRDPNDKTRLGALGNRLWHSDASFRAVPAKYSLLSAPMTPWTMPQKRKSKTSSPNIRQRSRERSLASQKKTTAPTTRTSCAR
jgi:alpha-ketoglutarate-dependent 2,4-dichlorophenoxyacetate dioxygenase